MKFLMVKKVEIVERFLTNFISTLSSHLFARQLIIAAITLSDLKKKQPLELFLKKIFIKISENSQGNACVSVSF